MGPIEDWHAEIEGKWVILFSHPADFTPVCTTEIGKLAISYDELESLGCKVRVNGSVFGIPGLASRQ